MASSDRSRFRRMVAGQVDTWTLPRVEPEALWRAFRGFHVQRSGLDCGWNSRELLSPTHTITSHFDGMNVEQNYVIFSPLS